MYSCLEMLVQCFWERRVIIPLDLLFVNKEGLVGDVRVGGHLEQNDHEIIEFLVLGEVRRGTSRTTTSDFWRAGLACSGAWLTGGSPMFGRLL